MRAARRAAVALGLLVALLTSGCTLQTAGAPTGDLELFALFDDVKNLVPGHAVRVGDVQVGSVQALELDGFRARVRMSIVDDRPVPEGTAAIVNKTSLLGEFFVELRFPEGADPDGPVLESGDTITDTSTRPDLEQVSQQAIEIIGAIATDDLGAVVDALGEGLGERGAQLHAILERFAAVTDTYAGRSEQIGTILDGMGRLGADLAAGDDEFDRFLVTLEEAAAVLADERDRMLVGIEEVGELARVLSEDVLQPHGDRLSRVLEDLAPVASTLAGETGRLNAVVTSLRTFATEVATILNDDEQLRVWVSLVGAGPLDTGAGDGDGTPLPLDELTEQLEDLIGDLGGNGGTP